MEPRTAQRNGTEAGGGESPALTVTVEEAGRMLGVSRGVAYAAVKAGYIPSIRLGRRLRVPRVVLLRMVGIENGDGAATNGPAENSTRSST